ncbi:hypothetical protein ACNFJ7_16535 [Sphingomonas sp. HT-1]|uniref:hypothetical protein n=1 Tax=unclassified Sphingomonas TaxID=196159 RepID=UPI0002E425D3|nr:MULTISPECIES: hypothetical protein [unclassified Sphingomonas]KTF70566.1 hypothetical protein ATB93_03405 [Sphingomonas sp. WG]
MSHDSRANDLAAQHLLPRANYKLTELAEEVARCARPLLPDGSKLFLGLEQNDAGSLRMIWWRGDDFRVIAEIEATPEAFCPEDSDEGILQDAAAACLTYLAGRWPTPPRRLGIITDGTGVAFSPARPAVAQAGWLMAHASGEAPLTAIVALAPRGPCALLCTPSVAPSRH